MSESSIDIQRLFADLNWPKRFDNRSLQRGRGYARNGHVMSCNTETRADGTCVITAKVSGSGRNVYRCTLCLSTSGGRQHLDAGCSCPVGSFCKHAVAVLSTLDTGAANGGPIRPPALSNGDRFRSRIMPTHADRAADVAAPDPASDPRKGQGMRAWQHWFDTLNPAQETSTVAGAELQFGVLLRADVIVSGQPLRLLACPVWMRPSKSRAKSKSAGLVDPQRLTLDSAAGPVPAPPDGWPAEVVSALVTLIPQQQHTIGGQRWVRVDARHLEQALHTLLQRYPVWFERSSCPLQWGDSMPLVIDWRQFEDGRQQLVAGLSDADAQLLRGAGLWYVNPKAGRVGRVDGDARLLDRLRYAPMLDAADAAEVTTLLTSPSISVPLPTPTVHQPARQLRVEPVAVLSMSQLALLSWRRSGAVRVAVARLRFEYDGIRFEPQYATDRLQHRLHGGELVAVERRFDREAHWLRRLRESGAVTLDDLPDYLSAYDTPDGLCLVWRPIGRKPPLSAEHCTATLEKLHNDGFQIEYDADFPRTELLPVGDWHADLEPGDNAWFDMSLGIDVAGKRIDLLPILRRVLADSDFKRIAQKGEKANASYRVALDEMHSIDLPLKRLRALIEPLLEWLEDDGKLRLHRSQSRVLDDLADQANLVWQGANALRQQRQLLDSLDRSAKTPRGFKATLRPYQSAGLAWLNFLGRAGLGGILADDMGLGKTVQVLAHLLAEKQARRLPDPALVVAPTSLVGNWRDEAARFAPRLKVLVIHGADRADRYDEIPNHDLVITTYPLLPRDRESLIAAQFSLLILDEAQAIKNASSQAAKVVREIPAARRLAMTGTPLENHLGELWAQFDAVEPGLLGGRRQFTKLYRTPIEKHGDGDRQHRLNRRIGPLMLRRRKDDVLTDLPAKTEIVRSLDLRDDQRGLYETLRLAQHQRVREVVRERGLAKAGIIVLDALLKLRQACCDPRLVKLPSAKKVKGSAKLEALLELLDGLLDEGRRVLLFSQFTEMLALIEAELVKRDIPYQMLTGKTPSKSRTALVKRFQQGGVPLFLISLKAGGVGLNLTAADTVIHYDPWWNPAVEAQATDRAHRIGQEKRVFVYRLIASGTVEEKIQALQGRKAELARAVLEGGSSQQLRFNEADLDELFAPL